MGERAAVPGAAAAVLLAVSCALLATRAAAEPCGGGAGGFVAAGARTRLWVCAPGAVRVAHLPTDVMPPRRSLVVVDDWENITGAFHVTRPSDRRVVVTTAFLSVTAEAAADVNAPWTVTATDVASGAVLLEEQPGGSLFAEVTDTPLEAKTWRVEQQWKVPGKGAGLYGGGEFQNGLVNWNPGGASPAPLQLVQFNTEAVVPFLVTSSGAGILFDAYSWSYLSGADTEGPDSGLVQLPLQNSSRAPTAAEWAPVLERPGLAPPVSNFTATFTANASGVHHVYVRGAAYPSFGTGFNRVLRVSCVDAATGKAVTVIDWEALTNLPDTTLGRVTLQKGKTVTFVVSDGGWKDGELPTQAWVAPPSTTMSVAARRADLIDYYVFSPQGPGRSTDTAKPATPMDGAIWGYRAATGAAPLYASWVYGFWQCKEHYHNQSELLGAAAEFRRLSIPVDSIVQDWHYWGNLGWGPQWDPSVYPDPAQMVSTLHSENIHLMVSVWSKFDMKTKFYKEMLAAGHIINGSIYYDPYDPSARDMFYNFSNASMFDIGVDALWLDATEPEGFPHANQTLFAGTGFTLFNPYSLMTSTAIADGLRRDYSDAQGRRVFALTRSSFAGQQRVGATLWSGDISGAWDSLRRQISASLNYAASGMPYWAQDIGGFFRPSDQYTSNDYHDMLIRWFQFGVFTPVFRVHGGGSNTELWNYGDQVMDTIVASAIRLRYRLFPYIYSGFARVATEGYTMQRVLAFDFAGDPNVLSIADQFMFGEAFHVAPIYTPVDGGSSSPIGPQSRTTRDVYLPESLGGWVDFYSGDEVVAPGDGARTVTASPTLNQSAVYVRGGSIVPLGPYRQYIAENPGASIEVRVYPGVDASFVLYEDDGESANATNDAGAHSTITFTWVDASGTLTIGARSGSFPGMVETRVFDVVFVSSGHGGGVEPCPTPDHSVQYTGASVEVKKGARAVGQ